MDLRGLWHPLVGGVPNDVRLGVPADGAADGAAEVAARTLLLTGPNMGGKSTLLRATCLAVIMAHVRNSPFLNSYMEAWHLITMNGRITAIRTERICAAHCW